MNPVSAVITICILTCLALMAFVLFKPSITIKNHEYSIYWVVVLVGALVLVFSGYLSFSEVLSGLTADRSINPIKILILFISMTILSIFLDEIGFFKYLANYALTKAKASQKAMFFYLFVTVSVLTVFTSNDIIILTFTPFICYFSKHAKINPIPYLFAEFVAANTWSMMLIIGNPTNVYLATSAGVSFPGYVKEMFLPTIMGGFAAFLLLFFIFRKSLSAPICGEPENIRIKDKGLLIIGLTHLSLCTVLLVLSSYLNFEMWLITLVFAISLFVCASVYMLITKKRDRTLLSCLARAPWELIPFVSSMFVLVLALDKYKITTMLSHFLDGSHTVLKYGVASFLTANLVNNIPMSVLFSSATASLSGSTYLQAVFAAVIGSNIGAFFTPLGALAGIMWSSILKKQNIKFSFATYIKYGVLISVPTLLMSLLGLDLIF